MKSMTQRLKDIIYKSAAKDGEPHYYYQFLAGDGTRLRSSYEFGEMFETSKECRETLRNELKKLKDKGIKQMGLVINFNNPQSYVGQIESNFSEIGEEGDIVQTVK